MQWFRTWMTDPAVLIQRELSVQQVTCEMLNEAAERAVVNKAKATAECVKAIKSGDEALARVYAETAKHEENAALDARRMRAQLIRVKSLVESSLRKKEVGASMAGIAEGLSRITNSQDFDALAESMDMFDDEFAVLEAGAATVSNAVESSTQMDQRTGEVDMMLKEIADANGLALRQKLTWTHSETTPRIVSATLESSAAER